MQSCCTPKYWIFSHVIRNDFVGIHVTEVEFPTFLCKTRARGESKTCAYVQLLLPFKGVCWYVQTNLEDIASLLQHIFFVRTQADDTVGSGHFAENNCFMKDALHLVYDHFINSHHRCKYYIRIMSVFQTYSTTSIVSFCIPASLSFSMYPWTKDTLASL